MALTWKLSSVFLVYIHENLVRIQPLVQKILCRQISVTGFSVFSTPVTLKITSRSPKSNSSLLCLNYIPMQTLVKIQPLVHKILCRQENRPSWGVGGVGGGGGGPCSLKIMGLASLVPLKRFSKFPCSLFQKISFFPLFPYNICQCSLVP